MLNFLKGYAENLKKKDKERRARFLHLQFQEAMGLLIDLPQGVFIGSLLILHDHMERLGVILFNYLSKQSVLDLLSLPF